MASPKMATNPLSYNHTVMTVLIEGKHTQRNITQGAQQGPTVVLIAPLRLTTDLASALFFEVSSTNPFWQSAFTGLWEGADPFEPSLHPVNAGDYAC